MNRLVHLNVLLTVLIVHSSVSLFSITRDIHMYYIIIKLRQQQYSFFYHNPDLSFFDLHIAVYVVFDSDRTTLESLQHFCDRRTSWFQ